MGHVCDKNLYETRVWDMCLENTLHGAPKWDMYVTNTIWDMNVKHVYVTCIWQIYYMRHIYGTCMWQIPIWDTYVGHVFGKYITNTYAISFNLLQNIVLLTVENPKLNLKSTYI